MTDQPTGDDMTDGELDQLLAAANQEMLELIRDQTDSDNALAAVMERDAEGGDDRQAGAALAIVLRIRGICLVSALTDAHDAVRAVICRDVTKTFASIKTRAFIKALEEARTLAGTFVFALDASLVDELNRALANHLGRARTFDRSRTRLRVATRARHPSAGARDRVLNEGRKLTQAIEHDLELARDLVRLLLDRQVDASGSDLSEVEIPKIEALDGVTWTDQTRWPPAIYQKVRAVSESIGEGSWRVRTGDAMDRSHVPSV